MRYLNSAGALSGIHSQSIPLAVNVMGLLILVVIGRVQEFVPGITARPLAKLLFIAMALLVISGKWGRDRQFAHPQIKAFVLLFALCCISVLTSKWPGESWRFVTKEFLSVGLCLFFLIKVCNTWRAIRRICWALVGSAILLSITTLAQYGQGRAFLSGTTYDPNDLAFTLVILLPFCYFITKSIERTIIKLLLFICMGGQVVTIMFTQSRGGLIGLLVVGVAILIHEKMRLASVLLIGGCLAVILSLYTPSGYWDRMSSIVSQEQDYNMTSGSGRLVLWQRGIGFMLENPLTGVGLNAFAVAEGESHRGQGKWSAAHNSFILIGAELGVFGLVLFIWMIFSSVKTVYIARHQLAPGSPESGLLSAIEIGFYGYVASGFFLSQAYATVLYLLVALTVAAANLTNKTPLENTQRGDRYATV